MPFKPDGDQLTGPSDPFKTASAWLGAVVTGFGLSEIVWRCSGSAGSAVGAKDDSGLWVIMVCILLYDLLKGTHTLGWRMPRRGVQVSDRRKNTCFSYCCLIFQSIPEGCVSLAWSTVFQRGVVGCGFISGPLMGISTVALC